MARAAAVATAAAANGVNATDANGGAGGNGNGGPAAASGDTGSGPEMARQEPAAAGAAENTAQTTLAGPALPAASLTARMARRRRRRRRRPRPDWRNERGWERRRRGDLWWRRRRRRLSAGQCQLWHRGGGGQGIIVITYTPVISATILAESRNAMEHQAVGRIDASAAAEFGLSVPSNVAVATEGRREIRCEDETPIEASSAALRSSLIPIQWAGSLAFYTDAFMPFEAAAALHRDALGFVEFACVISSNVQFRLELLTIPSSEALLPAESLTNGARISADGPLCLEWVDPPSLLMVAPERLLRSPGRIRLLAGPGSIHPLRGD